MKYSPMPLLKVNSIPKRKLKKNTRVKKYQESLSAVNGRNYWFAAKEERSRKSAFNHEAWHRWSINKPRE